MILGRDQLNKLKDREWLVREFWQMFRYGIVGGGSTLFFLGIYALLSKVIWRAGNPTLLDAVAIVISAVFNFMLHRAWSFNVRGFNAGMVRRYIITIVSASVAQVILFHVGTSWLGIMDFYVQIALVPIIAGFQYLSHRMYTFHHRYEKKIDTSASAEPEADGSVQASAIPMTSETE